MIPTTFAADTQPSIPPEPSMRVTQTQMGITCKNVPDRKTRFSSGSIAQATVHDNVF